MCPDPAIALNLILAFLLSLNPTLGLLVKKFNIKTSFVP